MAASDTYGCLLMSYGVALIVLQVNFLDSVHSV